MFITFADSTANLLAKNLFKNVPELRGRLINDYGIDETLVDTILNSQIDISKVLAFNDLSMN